MANKKNKRLLYALKIIAALVVLYFIGPKPKKAELDNALPSIPIPTYKLDAWLNAKESGFNVKPDNEAKILWANDSLKNQTDWCLLYLHGFSASRMEGMPTHVHFAEHFGMNLYMPRLADHGIDTEEPLINMTPDYLYKTAKESLVIAHKLGKKVVIMSCSTGGTLSLKLAADFPELVDALILYSPNVAINATGTQLLNKPWGVQIAKLVFGGEYRHVIEDPADEDARYWNAFYRAEAVCYLQQLVEETMTPETFQAVHCPTFMGYYYKDEQHQDPTVRVDAALDMFSQLATPDSLKLAKAYDAGVHVICYGKTSKAQAEVEANSIEFAEDVLHIPSAE